jgi:hypothetical protein
MSLYNYFSSAYNYVVSLVSSKEEQSFKKPDAYKNVNSTSIKG